MTGYPQGHLASVLQLELDPGPSGSGSCKILNALIIIRVDDKTSDGIDFHLCYATQFPPVSNVVNDRQRAQEYQLPGSRKDSSISSVTKGGQMHGHPKQCFVRSHTHVTCQMLSTLVSLGSPKTDHKHGGSEQQKQCGCDSW